MDLYDWDINELNEYDRNLIVTGEDLEETHIMLFHHMLEEQTDYKIQRPAIYGSISLIRPVPEGKQYIQILHCRLPEGHWVCVYYDSRDVYVFDSLNVGFRNDDIKLSLKALFPYINLKDIRFPKVQQQTGRECGFFAIAFAVTVLFGMKPTEVRYEASLMRNHLLNMFDTMTITHFPQRTQLLQRSKVAFLPTGQNKPNDDKYQKKVRHDFVPTSTDNSWTTVKRRKTRHIKLEPSNKKRKVNVVPKLGSIESFVQDSQNNKKISANKCATSMMKSNRNLKNVRLSSMNEFKQQISNKDVAIGAQSFNRNMKAAEDTPALKKRRIQNDRQHTWQGLPHLRPQYIQKECIDIITQNKCLQDTHMTVFTYMVQSLTHYVPYETIYFQNLNKIKPVPPYTNHIQILPGNFHWICAYYEANSTSLRIYDPNFNEHSTMNIELKQYVNKLFPYVDETSISFPKVQQQETSVDCGVFAIAFATSLLLDINPESVVYKKHLMRKHLLCMLQNHHIEHFPIEHYGNIISSNIYLEHSYSQHSLETNHDESINHLSQKEGKHKKYYERTKIQKLERLRKIYNEMKNLNYDLKKNNCKKLKLIGYSNTQTSSETCSLKKENSPLPGMALSEQKYDEIVTCQSYPSPISKLASLTSSNDSSSHCSKSKRRKWNSRYYENNKAQLLAKKRHRYYRKYHDSSTDQTQISNVSKHRSSKCFNTVNQTSIDYAKMKATNNVRSKYAKLTKIFIAKKKNLAIHTHSGYKWI